jgi:molybdopterin-guanine dinucleotide biosynthesis protein MobB
MVKVIPVAGHSGSGKTTLIRALIPLLARHGPVGTVKHTGHHSMELPKVKDTTVMFRAGAVAVAGINREKTLITLEGTSLADALDILAGHGVAVAIVEGYKSGPLPKIVIGEADVENCILRNPEPEEVIRSLNRFPDYFSIGGILRELGEKGRAGLVASATPLPPEWDENALSLLEGMLPEITEPVRILPGLIAARALIQRGVPFGRPNELLVAVAGGRAGDAAAGMAGIISGCRREMGARGIAFP